MRSALLCWWAALWVVPVLAAQALVIPRASRPPQLDDFLGGKAAPASLAISDFRQRYPGDGKPASLATTAYLSYDHQHLYAVFVCQEDRARVRARLAKREDIADDDRVGIWLDTFRDRRRAYYFVSNPLGIQMDGVSTDGRANDLTFDTVWHSEGRLTPDGFVVWMAIPFKSLRFPEAGRQVWGLAVGRYIQHRTEEVLFPHITERVEGFVQQFAILEGLENVSPGRNVQLIPYGAFTGSRLLDRGSRYVRQGDGRAGLDGKAVFQDALTLDVTLNPDFSQVESDEPQVLINQRFEVFFPERRPFFIENAGYFQTSENLFFSRRIADPLAGVRLTGKAGRWALGGLAVDDRVRNAAGQVDHAGIGVVSVRREFAANSSVGFLATSRDLLSGSNRVFSLDTRLKLNANWIFNAQAIRSYDRAPGGVRRSGPAYNAELYRRGRRLNYDLFYQDRSPDFRTQLGFVNRVDIRLLRQTVDYRFKPEGRAVLSHGPSVNAFINWDRAGRVQDWSAAAAYEVNFRKQTSLFVRRSENYELFQGRGFRQHNNAFYASTDRLRWLGLRVTFIQGTRVNYFPAAGLAPFTASSQSLQTTVNLRPTPRLRVSQQYLLSRLAAFDGRSIFNNHILRTKGNYQFTPRLSFRAILDYNAVLPNPSLAPLTVHKRFNADLLATYLVNPWTAFYVGYSDRYENLTLTGARAGDPSRPVARQLFAKLSYLWRF